MLERARLAANGLLTVANLFENLAGIYGDREVLDLAEPTGYRKLPSPVVTCRDALHFTNLAAEAFIRETDLKKGERVVLCIPEPAELLLVAVALVKAGGIIVPMDQGLGAGEMRRRALDCGARLTVADGGLLSQRADVARGMGEVTRLVTTGPRSRAPAGVPSLDEAMDASSGFFLPYTLKPGNVVGLFHARTGDGSLKAVMVTNEGLLGPHLRAAPLMPSRRGAPCLHAMALESLGGISSAAMGLCMGLRMRFMPGGDAEAMLEEVEKTRPEAFMAARETYLGMKEAGISRRDLSSLRLWFSYGDPLPRHVPDEFRGSSPARARTPGLPAFVEAYGARGAATLLALKPACRHFHWPDGSPGLIVPPNRAAVEGGDAGELVIRGPAVTPGYWNDIEGTLEAKRGGWLHTGIPATTKRCAITLR